MMVLCSWLFWNQWNREKWLVLEWKYWVTSSVQSVMEKEQVVFAQRHLEDDCQILRSFDNDSHEVACLQ